MAPSEISTCRSCSAPIVWARTSSEKLMPVDPEPTPDGNLVLFRDYADEWRVQVVGGADDRPRHRPHFATCPDAEGWRRR